MPGQRVVVHDPARTNIATGICDRGLTLPPSPPATDLMRNRLAGTAPPTGIITSPTPAHFTRSETMSTTQTQSAPTTQSAVVPANMFSLAGGGLHVSYSTTSIDGKPRFTYQDPIRTLSFQGDDIRKVECDLGTVVSVTIVRTVDAGSTTFSLLVPRVVLSAPFSNVSIHTDGVTTHHAFSIIPALNQGQRDFYEVTKLNGTASNVAF
jgi:hypothetical protein